MKERETVLAQLATDGWLAHMPSRAGCYTLGVRSTAQRDGWLLLCLVAGYPVPVPALTPRLPRACRCVQPRSFLELAQALEGMVH